MKTRPSFALALLIATGAAAQGADPPAHGAHGAPGAPSAPAASAPAGAAGADFVDGEVRRVDAVGGRITLRHGEIRNLDMPPMTMVFVARPELLQALKAGDKVRFRATRRDGGYAVTEIQPVR